MAENDSDEHPRRERRGEFVGADGGDYDMHAELLGEDDWHVTEYPLHPPTDGALEQTPVEDGSVSSATPPRPPATPNEPPTD